LLIVFGGLPGTGKTTVLQCSARLAEVEIVCSDRAEHRRRVEGRITDIDGHIQPTWSEVLNRSCEPWDRDHFVLDSAAVSIDRLVDDLEAYIGRVTL
jgi:broad-specificity NMP kinase